MPKKIIDVKEGTVLIELPPKADTFIRESLLRLKDYLKEGQIKGPGQKRFLSCAYWLTEDIITVLQRYPAASHFLNECVDEDGQLQQSPITATQQVPDEKVINPGELDDSKPHPGWRPGNE